MTKGATMGSNLGPHIEVAKLAIFNGEAGKVGRFITVYRLFLRMKLRKKRKKLITVTITVEWH